MKGNSFKIASWLLRKFLLSSREQNTLGDIEELYSELKNEYGYKYANKWYWRQVIKSSPHLINNIIYWGRIMLGNYSLIAIRNLLKNKLYSIINILGLAVGFACCIFIYLYLSHELSYDTFHQDYERIYRVPMSKKSATRIARWGINTTPLAPELMAKYPEVELAGRLSDTEEKSIKYGDLNFLERVNYADTEFLKIFSTEFVRGRTPSVLDRPETVVITESKAAKLFGAENPVGKKIEIDNSFCEITAVIKDVPENSHIDFDILLSIKTAEDMWWYTDWPTASCYTYIKLKKGTDPKEFESKISSYAQQYYSTFNQEGIEISYWLQPIADIHLYSHLDYEYESNGNPIYIMMFSGVGLIILFIACMNFINLSTACSGNRANEVGIRKAVGAYKKQLFQQFLFESTMIVFVSAIIAVILVSVSMEGLNDLAGVNFKLGDFINGTTVGVFGLIVVAVGLLSGLYPAAFISSFTPAFIFKGFKSSKSKGAAFRKVLVVFQFSISIILIISTIIIFRQIDFMMNSQLGFNKEQKLVLNLPRNGLIEDNHESVKNEFKKSNNVLAATVSSHVPGRDITTTRIYVRGKEAETGMSMLFFVHDYDFYDVYGLELETGRHHMAEMGTDTSMGSIVLNEAAVKAFGFQSNEEAMKQLFWRRGVPLIGIVKDFHFSGLQSEVEPMYTMFDPHGFKLITLQINTANLKETMQYVENKWSQLFPEYPFEYFFLDTAFNNQYKQEIQMGSLFRIFTLLGLVIACLGLFGLSAFMVEKKVKEIGIRKVLGASIPGIVMNISGEFLLLIGVSNIIAAPFAYYFMERWLRNFAYATSIYFDVFVIAGLLALLIALGTVGTLAIRAAYKNPIDSLRTE